METQRKTILLTVGLLAAVALFGAACDNEADSTPSTTAEAESADHPERPAVTTPANDPDPVDETAYTASLEGFGVETGTPELGVNLGLATCEAWDAGESFTATLFAISPLDGSGFTSEQAGYIMAASAMFLCPDHLAAATAWSEEAA